MKKVILKGFVIFSFIVLILEVSINIYIFHFADEETITNYASVIQLARLFNKDRKKLRIIPHPYTLYMLTPNYEKGCNRHNSYGFRGEELKEKREDEIWIVCIGESTTYDYDIECWENTYPTQLEKYLKEQGINGRVINAGVDGWTSYEIMIDFYLRITQFPIDILIYYGGFNDVIFTRLIHPIPKNLLKRDITCARWGVDGMFNYPIWEESSLIRIVLLKAGLTMPHFDLFSMHLSQENRFTEFIVQLLRGTYPSGVFKDVPIETILKNNPPIGFEQNVRNIVSLAREKSILPVLTSYVLNTSGHNSHFIVTEPEAVKLINQSMASAIQEMNNVVEKVSQDYNVPYLDLAKVFPIDGNLFTDLIHNNEQGARVKAELIGKFLIDSGIIKSP